MRNTRITQSRHPERLLSLVYFDGLADVDGRRHQLTGYGALEVGLEVPLEPVFTSHHVTTWDGEGRYGLIGDLGSLVDDRHVLLGSPDAQTTFWDRRRLLRAGTEFIDTMEILDGPVPSGLTLAGHKEESLRNLADGFEISLPLATKLPFQARLALDRAQVIWLAYVMSNTTGRETNWLLAAFRAWRAIQNARPIPF